MTDAAATMQLQCRAGHVWARPRQRGKPPAWCPEHRPENAAPATKAGARTEGQAGQPRRVRRAAANVPIAANAEQLAEWWSVDCANPARCPEHRAAYRAQVRALQDSAA